MRYAETVMMAVRDLHPGADVYSSDGKKLGTLHRVVLNRTDLRVTHVVVDIGFLRSGHHIWEPGIGLDYDRVVPIESVLGANDKRVELHFSAQEFKNQPEYTDDQFEPPQDLTPKAFDLFDATRIGQSVSASLNFSPYFWIVPRLNKLQDERDIAEGTPVWRQQPHEKLGEVDRVLVDTMTGRAEALVVKRGFLRKRDVVLPVRYISELLDDIVRVKIGDAELDQLQEYRGSDG